ncbi:MAG: antibiotic biosynthesis monooxygenase [Acidimicrobiia bacterium]
MLAYTIRGSIKDADNFKAVASELSAQVEAGEPGTQAYQWFLSRDGSSGMLYEQFENTEALLTHFGNVTPVMDRFMATIDIEGVFAFGEIDDEAKAALDTLGAVYGDMVAGFMRG